MGQERVREAGGGAAAQSGGAQGRRSVDG